MSPDANRAERVELPTLAIACVIIMNSHRGRKREEFAGERKRVMASKGLTVFSSHSVSALCGLDGILPARKVEEHAFDRSDTVYLRNVVSR
jgi:hypothetical protein